MSRGPVRGVFKRHMFVSLHSPPILFDLLMWPVIDLLIWGLLLVGTIDNFVKPFFIRGGVELHGAVVFFSLLGGLAAFGPVGIIAGPLVIAFFVAITRMQRPAM